MKLRSSKEKELYAFIYELTGFCPRDIRLYRQALCHRSEAKNSPEGRSFNNERLEFLGDAVLGTVIADLLYRKFRRGREGFLTNTRSKIVKRDMLNRLAEQTGVVRHLKYSPPAHVHHCSVGGNAVEALIGAVYIDRGYDCCRRFVEERLVNPYIDISALARKEINFKTKLLEWCQKFKIELDYELIALERDADGCQVFKSSVILGGIEAGHGIGYTKKESQQKAAREALSLLDKTESFRNAVLRTAVETAVAE